MKTDIRGFTLIELLIVVVIIGILAAIAIPKYSSVREDSYIAAVTSDMKNLASQQEVYHATYQTYASDVADISALTLSDGVTLTINEADGTGWAATGTHAAISGRQCGIFYGDASASNATPATTAGVVICQG
jgi:prepilin-type N-terminal cleavage/methylation domain-containing protein